jgi:hypothetical protein
MLNHFVLVMLENKETKWKQLYYDITERVDLYDMEYIVEPFCGTSANELLHSHTTPKLEFNI